MAERLQTFFDNARKATFEYNGAKITVREGLAVDQLDGQVYRRFLRDKWREEHDDPKAKIPSPISDVDWNRMVNFTGFIVRTVQIKGKMPGGFKLPSPDDADSWYKAYWLFLKFPVKLVDAWDTAMMGTNNPVAPPEAPPGDDENTTNT